MSAPGNVSVRLQFAETMLDVGQKDSDLVVMVGDISHGIMKPYAEACPGRYFNIGILEPTMMSMGAGFSAAGLVPVVHTIAPFLIERSFEQIKLDYVYHNLPGNIVTVGSAFDYGNLGCTHHCYGDFAMLKTLQGVQVLFPSSPVEFDTLFKQAYRNDHVTVYRLPAQVHGVDFAPSDLEVGKAIRVAEGSDLTLIATGPQLGTAIGARDQLAADGWDAEILYIHSVRPLDEDAIVASVAKTRKVVVIEEHMRSGGLGDDVLRACVGRGVVDGLKYISASIPDTFVRGYGKWHDHCQTLGLTADAVAQRVRDEFGPK